jgi:hypothetical protein
MSMQEMIVYAIVAACVVWAAVRICRSVKRIRKGQNVCSGCGGACGGRVEDGCPHAGPQKNQEK